MLRPRQLAAISPAHWRSLPPFLPIRDLYYNSALSDDLEIDLVTGDEDDDGAGRQL